MKITVTINATEENPWHKLGFRHNPFPQIALSEFAAGEKQLASLDGEPVRSADDIRERLRGFDPEFIEELIKRAYRPGKRVPTKVEFPI